MHHNEARPVNCDGGRSSMKVQNQVRVWPVGQRTSSWHITDMWDRSVSKPISIDGKEPTCRSLRETRSENTQTGSHGGQDIFEHGWSISSLHVGLPFSALLRNKCVLYQRLRKIRVQRLHHAVLVVVLLVLLNLALGSSPLREVEQWWYSACSVLQCMPLAIWHRMNWCMSTAWARVRCISQKA